MTKEEWTKKDGTKMYLVSEVVVRAGMKAGVEADTVLSLKASGKGTIH